RAQAGRGLVDGTTALSTPRAGRGGCPAALRDRRDARLARVGGAHRNALLRHADTRSFRSGGDAMSSTARVGIFDADAPPAIAFVRSLGRAGIPLRVYSHRRWPVCRYSRWCAEFSRCPDPASGDFVSWLSDELRSGRIDLVAPTSDVIAFHVATLGDVFAPDLRARIEPAEGIL